MTNIIPKNKHAVIRFTKLVLNKSYLDTVTYEDVDQVRDLISQKLQTQSPKDIQKFYNFEYSDFGMFIKKCLGLKLKTSKEAVTNFYAKMGRTSCDAKAKYRELCSFTFDPFAITKIPGYDLLIENGIYHPHHNLNGVCRDHIVSVDFGWRNDINPQILSHPANCQFLLNSDNSKKGNACSISVLELERRIYYWNLSADLLPVANTHKQLPKTQEHKDKISLSNSNKMNVTNGCVNLRIKKTDLIPDGFKRGLTRKNKNKASEPV